MFIKNRFHTCFLPTSTFQRFGLEFLSTDEQQDEATKGKKLLETMIDAEQENTVETWRRCSLPHVLVGDGKSITQALIEYCGDTTLARRLLEDVKQNVHNQVVLAKYWKLSSPLAPADTARWDNIPQDRVVLAVPTLVTITRHYMDISSRSVAIFLD